jgi:hypothetical protein
MGGYGGASTTVVWPHVCAEAHREREKETEREISFDELGGNGGFGAWVWIDFILQFLRFYHCQTWEMTVMGEGI